MPPKFKRHMDHEQRVHLMGDTNDSDGDDVVYHQRDAKGSTKSGDKLTRVQDQVADVVGVMQANIGKVLDRGDRLEDLQDKTDDLAAGALTFHKSASKLQQKMWWRNMKMRLCFVLIILIIIAFIAIPIIVTQKKSSKP
ncbi:uncharacterized protein LOC135805823 [Sycon ciliatum]|uniref:uncharacterized protein LOC135805823 n=1 Tax=Sycon ciliatum TaxID=27933 RepID=UPI0020A9BC4B|eukprot:scpid70790/ scgid15930/ Synaptobrevin homolog 1